MCAKTLAVKYPHTHTLTHTQKKKTSSEAARILRLSALPGVDKL